MILTKRYVSPGAEDFLFRKVKPTASGEVELIDYMGGDATVLRVATAGHGKGVFVERFSDRDVFSHLVSRGILAPFRSVQLQFSIQSPIETALRFVYDQRISVNEYSGRYSKMLDTGHVPTRDEILESWAKRGGTLLDDDVQRASRIVEILKERRASSLRNYELILETDFARELARAGLGTDNDTRFYWKVDLVSLADFVTRHRSFGHTKITKAYVEAVARVAEDAAPDAWAAILQYNQLGRLPLTLRLNDDQIVDPALSPAAWEETETKRVVVPALEEILFVEQKYLDHGAFQVVDYLGDESTPAKAARTSYGEGTKKLSDDVALIRTLVRDLHTSPIEMTSLAFEAKTPVFVDPRQAARHRTLATHQFMGFTPLGSRYYLPPLEEMKYQDRINRQGRGKAMDAEEATLARGLLEESYEQELRVAEELRSLGAPEEVIRAGKGVGFYTRTWRSGDGHNLGHFLRLRLDPHAQKEIRDFAALVNDAHRRHIPSVNQALFDYHIQGMRLSEAELIQFAQFMDFGRVDIESLDTYRAAGFVKRRKKKGEDGIFEEFLGLEGEGMRNKLRRLEGLSR